MPSNPGDYVQWRRAHPRQFLFQALPAPDVVGHESVAVADAVLGGKWPYFSRHWIETGFPPDWHRNPLTGMRAHDAAHWSRVGETDTGDVKWIWETSRFGVVYPLARAYALTGATRFASAFWRLVEDWCRHNPPNRGANWGCGQEAAFRVFAWIFALRAFREAGETTAERVAMLVCAIAWHTERIEKNLAYAISQRNNHGISEAAALWTVGLLFPELARAEHWRELGRRHLEAETRRQVFEDGAFVQHSMNYHRLMLEVLVWAIRVGDANGDIPSPHIRARIGAASEWLAGFVDRTSGAAPNYGANDGAWLFPLASCDYQDMRPIVQLARAVATGSRTYPAGPWDEALAWFGVTAAAGRERVVDAPRPGPGGYHRLEAPGGWAMIRCARFTTRPSHADQLHLDLWWRGINVACDAGTYLYTAAPPWDNALAATAVHNTATIDGQDQMRRAGRFLWLRWAQGLVRRFEVTDDGVFFEGEHGGYRLLGATHRRAVWTRDDVWVVVDDVSGEGRHRCRLHWLHPDVPHVFNGTNALQLATPAGAYSVRWFTSAPALVTLVRGGSGAEPTRGFRSRYYGDLEPALSLAVEVEGALPVRFVTCLGAGADNVTLAGLELEARPDGAREATRLQLAPPGITPIIARRVA